MSRLIRWWPVLAWAALIWIFSTSWFTSENTGRIIEPVFQWLLPHASLETIDLLHAIVRKCGHVTEYFIFSLLVLRSLRAGRRGRSLKWALITISIVAAYASIDEFHQSFVPGRTAAVSDVLLDTAGGTIAQVLVALWPSRSRRQFEARPAD
jgi:VanZ family protein